MRNWLAVTGAILLVSCSQPSVDTSAAERGVAHFRRLMDAQDYGAIYAGAASEFRQNGEESTIMRFLEAVETRLGRVREANQQGWRYTVNNNGSYMSLAYATTFEHGRGTEEFVFRIDGHEAKLAGYHINSMELVIDQIAPTNDQAAGNEVTRVEALPRPSEPRNEMESRRTRR